MNQDKFEKLYGPKKENVALLIPFLMERPRPADSIARFLNRHKVSVWSYLRTLRDLGVDVKKDEHKKYYIDAKM